MAPFTIASAEARVKAKGPYGDRTWVNAFTQRATNGVISIRVQRYMSSATPASQQNGEWIDRTDDGQT